MTDKKRILAIRIQIAELIEAKSKITLKIEDLEGEIKAIKLRK